MGHAYASEDTFIARMQNILLVANNLKELTAASNSSAQFSFSTGHSPIAIDSIDLPTPPPLLPLLLEAGADNEIAIAANNIYQLRAEELRKNVQVSIITASHKMANLPVVASASSPHLLIRRVVTTATDIYLQRVGQWKEEIVQRVKQAPASTSRSSRTFNYEYVPLLEHFFEENPFPTHADKLFLAKKSSMEYRQIHVWFQNRRNRTRKEGKMLRKKLTHEGAMKSSDKLYKRTNNHTGDPEPPRTDSITGTTEVDTAQDGDVLTSSPPPHAFPSSYPPTCHYDPFPCKSGSLCFGKPEWRHLPNEKHLPPLSIGIDDLAEMFSRLNVRDAACSSPKSRSHAATAAITVIPSCAPHPALIVRKYSQPTNIAQLRPSVRAPASRLKAFQSPSPTSKPVTLVPLSVASNNGRFPGKQKVAPLPQCFPGRVRNTRRDTTPSESSSTSSFSPRLLPTNLESRTCSLSSVSSLSTPPDVANIQELPKLLGSPCRSPSDSPIHLLGLGDMVPILPSAAS